MHHDRQSISIIDLGSGNLRSVQRAVERAAADHDIAADVAITTSPDAVHKADRIIVPGVGAFGACMAGLNALDGMRDALEAAATHQAKPILGICVGMQMLASRGMEFGETPGLGWIPGTVKKLHFDERQYRVPHMGWNQLHIKQNHDLFDSQNNHHTTDVYFLHSYHFETEMNHHITAVCDYGPEGSIPITAAIAKDTIIGVQFHPEKSQKAGLHLLANFLRWSP